LVRISSQLLMGGSRLSYLCYLCLFASGGVQHVFTAWVT